MKQVLVLIGFLLAASPLPAQHYNRYCNAVFTFCADIPGNFNRAGASMEGNGQFFKASDGSTLTIYGSSNSTRETLPERLTREQTALAADTTLANFTQLPVSGQAETQENSFTLTYQHQAFTHLIFRKLVNNTWTNLELRFPAALAREYEPRISHLLASLK